MLALILGSVAFAADADSEARRRPYLEAMTAIMGPMPDDGKRCPLDLRVESESESGGVIRREITYQSEPGSRVPAYLLLPSAAVRSALPERRFPGVLALHQTHPAGRKVVVGLGQSPDDEYGLELARRGYVVLAPPYPHLADYAPDLRGLGYVSGTLKAVWDNRRGLDVLASLPWVRTNGFGCIGHSLGGHNGLFTAAWDPRIRAVSSCGLDSFRDYYDGNPEVWRPGKGWCQERYMPRLAEYHGRLDQIPFDFPQVLAAIAPRRVLIFAPLNDTNFRWRSVDRVAEEARALSARDGVSPDLRVEHPPTAHRFPPEAREQAYRAMDEVLVLGHSAVGSGQ
ncbi:MAG: alpha/beta hydrolase [Verrucomicrobiae bacterium]|nr:alpha/beta hydrolase [Verrucomicrobiae bacterium]